MIIVQVFCLFISAMVTLINIYKLHNIKKVLLTLEELDNLEDDDRNIILNNTTYILNDDKDKNWRRKPILILDNKNK